MAGESKEGTSLPISGIVGAIMVIAAVVVQQTRLDSARPAPTESKGLVSRPLHQDIESRLWHDPFALVAQFRERKRQEAVQEGQLRRLKSELSLLAVLPPDDEHTVDRRLKGWLSSMLCAKKAEDRDAVRLLMPMLMGGRPEENAEMRRRTRYAVVSGLINAKYNPDDPDAISYAYISPEQRYRSYETQLPEVVPFEWFGRELDGNPKKKEWVLVLWLDQDNFHNAPIAQARALVDVLTPACDAGVPQVDKTKFDATVLGPLDSEVLALVESGMQREVFEEKAGAKGASRTPVHFVSASATGPLQPSQYFFETSSGAASLGRVVGPDERLIEALEDELHLRLKHFKVTGDRQPAVVVISEHDTDYGRAFVKALEKKAASRNDFKPETFSYLRQIDGGHGGAQRQAKGADREKDAEKVEAPQPQLRSHGLSQIDYLDRLVRDIEEYADSKKKDIVAVGIFGNDVYDKLLVLRALRPAFPKAQFVTTDLDARLLDADEAAWARNLVVATNFGLTLDRAVQGGASPFRDGYQTASYLAAWLYGGQCATSILKKYGAGKDVPPWLREPLRFEIGRHKPIPLLDRDNAGSVVNLAGCTFPKGTLTDGKEVRFQPALKRPVLARIHLLVLAGLAVVVLAALMWWAERYQKKLQEYAPASARPKLRWPMAGVYLLLGLGVCWLFFARLVASYPDNPLTFMLGGVAVSITLCVGLWRLTEGFSGGRTTPLRVGTLLLAPAIWLIAWTVLPAVTPNAEPFVWAEGISVWPTQLLRAFAAVFAGFSLWYVGAVSACSMVQVAKRFQLASAAGIAGDDKRKFMADIWRDYTGGRSSRIGWTIVAALGYLIACFGVMYAFDARPGIPLRGDHAPEVAALLGFAVFMGITLLAGMMQGCRAFIQAVLGVATKSIPWFPNARVAEFRETNNLLDHSGLRRFIDSCLSVDLVAERSESLIGLIYLPFAVFALLLVARSQLFDNWDTPLGLLIVLGLPFLMVIGCMVWLYAATMAFHRKAIRKAQQQLIRLRGETGVTDAHMWQLDKLFEKMCDEKRGSFQNILLQPMIRALLFPLGGISALELLEQFVLNR